MVVFAPPPEVLAKEGERGEIPSSSLQPQSLPSQLERRKSVKDLVTDFSSCISTSGEEEPALDYVGPVTRRKKKKRKASTSPIIATVTQKDSGSIKKNRF